MDWSVAFRSEGDVLIATATGSLDPKGYLSVRDQIRARLDTGVARKVLLDLRGAALHVSAMDVFETAASNPKVIPRTTKYAIVFSGKTLSLPNISFGENVASNRGAQLHVFDDVSKARRWLTESPDAPGDAPGPAKAE